MNGEIILLPRVNVLRAAASSSRATICAQIRPTMALRTPLFNVPARDPLTFVVAAVALVTIALTASWIPARAATTMTPSTRCAERPEGIVAIGGAVLGLEFARP